MMNNSKTVTKSDGECRPLDRMVTPRPDDPGWLDNWPRRNKAGDAVVMWDEFTACIQMRHKRCNNQAH